MNNYARGTRQIVAEAVREYFAPLVWIVNQIRNLFRRLS